MRVTPATVHYFSCSCPVPLEQLPGSVGPGLGHQRSISVG